MKEQTHKMMELTPSVKECHQDSLLFSPVPPPVWIPSLLTSSNPHPCKSDHSHPSRHSELTLLKVKVSLKEMAHSRLLLHSCNHRESRRQHNKEVFLCPKEVRAFNVAGCTHICSKWYGLEASLLEGMKGWQGMKKCSAAEGTDFRASWFVPTRRPTAHDDENHGLWR